MMDEFEIKAWQSLAQGLKERAVWDIGKVEKNFQKAISSLPLLAKEERNQLWHLAQKVAERSSKLAVIFLGLAPQTMVIVDQECRQPVLAWAEIFASASRETLLTFLEKIPLVLAGLPKDDRSIYSILGWQLAQKDWSVSLRYFDNLVKINAEIPRSHLFTWFAEGIKLLPQNVWAARAYFALESKYAQDRIKEHHPAVCLEEVARTLKIFAQALAGKELQIHAISRNAAGVDDPPYPFPYTDGEKIYLPLKTNEFSDHQQNYAALKLAVAHQAGYMEWGTFNLRLSAVADLFPLQLWQANCQAFSAKGKATNNLELFFSFFAQQDLARDLFHLLEGLRIDKYLYREYRGLRADLDFHLRAALKKRPPILSLPLQAALRETILHLGIAGKPPEVIPGIPPSLNEELSFWIKPLFLPGSTVEDVARVTVMIYRWLRGIPNVRGREVLFSLPSLKAGRGDEEGWRKIPGEEPYRPMVPLPHWGELRPELLKSKISSGQMKRLTKEMEKAFPLSPEKLRELLRKGVEIEVTNIGAAEEENFQGLFLSDVHGWKSKDGAKKLKENTKGATEKTALLLDELSEDEKIFFYDEWDYLIKDYRPRWCFLREKKVEGGSPKFVSQLLEDYPQLIKEVRRQFQMLKPERWQRIYHLERGEEIDLDALIEAVIDRQAGMANAEKIYLEKKRKERDISTLFLLDMSASTEEGAKKKTNNSAKDLAKEKKVIDIAKETLVIMAEALKEIGDEYAIFGFSGYGRKNVEFFAIKDFDEEYSAEIQSRIDGIRPQRSTRMGTAIRHAAEKIRWREAKIKNLILISDGYPQDYDYGEERGSKEYALQDTMKAIQETMSKKIFPFCLTIDQAGHDYLRQICPPGKYLVIEDIYALPQELPKIYRRLTT